MPPTDVSGPVAARRWTRAMDGFLRRMHARGRKLTWIAKALAMSRPSCVARAEALGVVERRSRAAPVPCGAGLPEPAPIGPWREVLDEGVCHWVAGSSAARAWRMCGHPSVYGTFWCAHHLARVRLDKRNEGREVRKERTRTLSLVSHSSSLTPRPRVTR